MEETVRRSQLSGQDFLNRSRRCTEQEGKVAVLLSWQHIVGIEDNLKLSTSLQRFGAKNMQLTYNVRNSSGARYTAENDDVLPRFVERGCTRDGKAGDSLRLKPCRS